MLQSSQLAVGVTWSLLVRSPSGVCGLVPPPRPSAHPPARLPACLQLRSLVSPRLVYRARLAILTMELASAAWTGSVSSLTETGG